MAELFLTWEEAQDEQLPHFCVSCARPATDWADWRICHARHGLFSSDYTFVDVTLPVCPQHRNLEGFLRPRIVAREVYDDGLLLGRVSPGFVEAVWDDRDVREGRPVRPRPRRFATTAPASDFEDYAPRRSLARRPYRPRGTGFTSPGWTFLRVLFGVLAALFFAPFVLLMMCGALGLLFQLLID